MTTEPLSGGALTPDALTQALRAAGVLHGARVATVHTTPIGVGMVGDCLRVMLTYDGDAPAAPRSLIAKLPSRAAESRAAGATHQLYVREVSFFRELASRLAIRVPRAWRAEQDLPHNDFVLLLEDMGPARMGDQIAGCALADAEIAMDQAAALHAPLWGSAALDDLTWLNNSRETINPLIAAVYPSLEEGFAARYADRLSAEDLTTSREIASVFGRMITDRSSPGTVQHGDFRLDNIMFDICGGREPMATLDWQTLGHGAGAADVAYFIGTGFEAPARRAVERDLVRRWHDGLCAGGVQNYDFATAWHDYRRFATGGLTMAVIASVAVTATARGDEMFLAMARRSAAMARDLDCLGLWVA